MDLPRTGEVIRILPHGTTIVWDDKVQRAYPYYDTGYRVGDAVFFGTDAEDRIVTAMILKTKAAN